MGWQSDIEWTDHTFNPWWGCMRVSEACRHCYAAALDHRFGGHHWGVGTERRFFGDGHWAAPLKWNRRALRNQQRVRVFCASMGDVFEEGGQELSRQRERLWRLIDDTPALDWLLLTKRPENVRHHIPWGFDWPDNVWLGTTVEKQKWCSRLDAILAHDARIHFVSCEPLLEELNLEDYLMDLDWVIAGGESGPGCRPVQADWMRVLRDQCSDFEVPFFFKQWGGHRKKKAGRQLDGHYYNGIPVLHSLFS